MLAQLFESCMVKCAEQTAGLRNTLRARWSVLPPRQRTAALAALAAIPALCLMLVLWFGDDAAVGAPLNSCVLIDSESGACSTVTLKPGMGGFPMRNSRTGRLTLWPAEFCFSAQCAAYEGTPVLLNRYLGKPEPTHCPRCGALVTQFNPRPPSPPLGKHP
jgi:hypothetical protein